jgi:hypothetical protein
MVLESENLDSLARDLPGDVTANMQAVFSSLAVGLVAWLDKA